MNEEIRPESQIESVKQVDSDTPVITGTLELENQDDTEHSAVYYKNEKTGQWEVRNPSGSMGYNYLYRDFF